MAWEAASSFRADARKADEMGIYTGGYEVWMELEQREYESAAEYGIRADYAHRKVSTYDRRSNVYWRSLDW